jgi:DNA-binding transcriptional ArsR family regulator
MDDDKIVLDRRSFEALAVDTRVKILKSLKERRKTLTEIAKEEGMSVSGIKEHLSILENVGLIEKIDDGHKWKYYELTKKGREVIGPKEVRVMIILSTSILALLVSLVFMLGPASTPMAHLAGAPAPAEQDMRAFESGASDAPLAAKAPETAMVEDAAPFSMNEVGSANPADENFSEPDTPVEQPEELPIPLIVAGISLLTIVGCLGILARNRMK